jgi:hypothetical protein
MPWGRIAVSVVGVFILIALVANVLVPWDLKPLSLTRRQWLLVGLGNAPYVGFGLCWVAFGVWPIRQLIYVGGALGLIGMAWYGWFGGRLERYSRRRERL